METIILGAASVIDQSEEMARSPRTFIGGDELASPRLDRGERLEESPQAVEFPAMQRKRHQFFCS